MTKKIAIIGAGAKAAAISAKAACLNRHRQNRLEITIFERFGIGANWSGRHGYTDGRQRLCTPAERDLGFPYEPGVLSSDQVNELYAHYSWGAYQVAQPPHGRSYLDWVNRGRNPPTHGEFAAYLEWAIRKSGAVLNVAEVTGIGRAGDKWAVRTRNAETGRAARFDGFDGVVVTGPGGPRRPLGNADHPCVTDGVQFWKQPRDFLKLAGDSDDPVVIVGAGGTAAAVAAWMVRHSHSHRPILIIGDQAALFTRPESFFENVLFGDEQAWQALSPNVRADFTRRLNRGVVWATVSRTLAISNNIRFVPGTVERLLRTSAADDLPDELTVAYKDHGGSKRTPASLVVDASGFDGWWFASLLPAGLRDQMVDADMDRQKEKQRRLEDAMRHDLSLPIAYGGLHAPMLSQAVGPGFLSLMVLGSMSDRVLRAYV
jgi:mycobactin lysine-N-oxygenase